MMKKFEISYYVVLRDGSKEPHKTRIANCDHDAHAKIKLDKHCAEKYKSKGYITIEIDSCKDVTVEDFFKFGKNNSNKDIFNSFNDIFGGKL